jgi:hypothetical protein
MPNNPKQNIYDVENLDEALTFKRVCPLADLSHYNGHINLESVSFYQTIDLLTEGEIAGLCDKHGTLLKLTNDTNGNEDGLKGIYLNDAPVKNTDANTLNFNRVFADFKTGSKNQTGLAKSNNTSLSFDKAAVTSNFNVMLPGLASSQSIVTGKGDTFNVVGEGGSPYNLCRVWNTISTDGKFGVGAFGRNFVYNIKDANTIDKVKTAEKAQVISINHVITNDNVNEVQINMVTNGLRYSHSDGDISNAAVNFVIKVGYVDDEVTLASGEGSVIYLICGIEGKLSSPYARTYNVPLPVSGSAKRDRVVKIFRVDRELRLPIKFQKSLGVQNISEIVKGTYTYPNSSLIGMVFDARAFAQPPSRRFDVKMTKVSVPSNYNPETRSYDGNWDGSFKNSKEWTDNPAWVFYDLATNKRYGVGKYGFKSEFVDKWNLYSVGKYCDEFVPTGYSGKYGNMDFTCSSGGVVITIDDSSNTKGADKMLERYPEGGIVCLFDLKNSSSENLDKASKRVIINPSYNTSDNTFSFKIVKIPDAEYVLKEYPDVKADYLLQAQGSKLDTQKFLIDYLIHKQNTSSTFVADYRAGEPLDLGVTNGSSATQFYGFKNLVEPRFRCNLFLDRKQNAFNALNDIAAIFRGMIYWSSGYISVSNDQSREAVMLFTNANVADGQFVYSGSAETSRSTAVIVRFNDENDSYKPKTEYLEDPASVRQYGYIDKEIIALGVTSRAQAHRLAKWMLYTNQTETDTIQFTTGQEGSYLKPGDVIKVQDKLKTSKRYGGRIKGIDYGEKTLTLDEGIQENIVNQKITVIVPRENKTIRSLNKKAESKIRIAIKNQEVNEGIPDSDLDSSREPQIKQFTIASVSETNVITISETTDEDFNLIKKGFIWSVQNTNTDYEIEEVEYRIIGITEQNSNQYQVTGMMYNRTKFAAVDESRSIENTQQSKSNISVGALPTPLSGDTPISITNVTILKGAILPYFEASFPDIQANDENYYINIDFSSLAVANGVTFTNTGGYIVEVFKSSGERIRFSLSGHDNTTASVLIGSLKSQSNLSVDIYRYDPSFKVDVGF